jgi:hypothetical protein
MVSFFLEPYTMVRFEPYTMVRFEPGSAVSEADAMSTMVLFKRIWNCILWMLCQCNRHQIMVSCCCETAGFSRAYKMNLCWTVCSQWMYFKCRALLFIPDKSEPDTDRESDATTYTGVHCVDVIFERGIHWPYLLGRLGNLISMLAYIYSILRLA